MSSWAYCDWQLTRQPWPRVEAAAPSYEIGGERVGLDGKAVAVGRHPVRPWSGSASGRVKNHANAISASSESAKAPAPGVVENEDVVTPTGGKK